MTALAFLALCAVLLGAACGITALEPVDLCIYFAHILIGMSDDYFLVA